MLVLIAASAMKQPALRLPAVFGSNMVLQRNTHASIWGWAPPRANVILRAGWLERPVTVQAKADGTWRTKLPTGAAGGPYDLNVSASGALLRYVNVMLGEVWLCSGQSNMWWPLGPNPGMTEVENARAEVAAAQYPDIRLFSVPATYANTPQTDCLGGWTPCSPQTAATFSATAYFFGRELHKKLGVPVGLVCSAVGGTESELWTSYSKLITIPEFKSRILASNAADTDFRKLLRKALQVADPAADAIPKSTFDDRAWPIVRQPHKWSGSELKAFDGVAWYRKQVFLTAKQARTNAVLELGPLDDEDETFVNGAMVGATNDWFVPRSYDVPARLLRPGVNHITVRLLDVSGEGGFVGGAGGLRLRFPNGASASLAGDWKFRQGPKLADLPVRSSNGPRHSRLFNGMIAPLAPFSIKGAIWYQGESNVSRGSQYNIAFPAMIKDWRAHFENGEFPFYFVQIAPFPYSRNTASCDLREAQANVLRKVANTGMAATNDLAPDVNDIHPPLKRQVGERLALLALSRTYGPKQVDDASPLYRSMSIDGSKVRLHFDHASLGFRPDIRQPNEFTIAGADQKFYPADVRIEGSTIVVTSPNVPAPKAVRYGWSDTAQATVFGQSGLPLTPFRTDRWPTVTQNAKW